MSLKILFNILLIWLHHDRTCCYVCVSASQVSLLAALANVAWSLNWFAVELDPPL